MEGTPWRALWMLGHLVSLVSCDTSCMLQHRHVGPTGIPCTIHQLDAGELSKTSNTWTSMNPECNHKLWNATQVETLVREQSPDLIWPIWDSLSVEERGDVFRYLVIWHQGGWWADSDVACLKPIADFPVPSNATMIVGYEFGHRWSEKQRQEVNFARTEQFAKYFFAAAPRNPVLLRCLRMVRQRFSWKILQTSDFTGSALFSDAVNEFLESDESLNKDSVKRKNMEVHLNKLRMLNLGICARMGVQTQLILMIFAAKKVSDGYEDAYWDVLFRACLYVCFSCASFISKRDMSYTIRPLCLCFYIALLGRMWACFDMQQYHANQAYVVGKTCLMATLFVDMWVAIPMGIFISFLDARLFISHGGDLVDNEVSSRVAVLILYIFIPTVAELTARRFIQGLLDAHLMVAGFRKMLKGISDGEFLTDSNFNIHGDAKCLENLLALNAELTGTSFLSWLWDDKEQHAFQQFVWTDKEEESAPGCLRIHLRNSKGQSVALDACHVKVPDLFGAVQPYHLIALKEDPEQVIEDRPDAQVAGSLPPQLLTSDQRSNRAAASSSEGSLCSSCIVDSMKELSEMTFLLDGSSEHFDMLEAHLRFNRVTDDLTSAMPHLRKFARPVDWGWLSTDIAQYIWTCFSQTSVPGPISVGPMFFRMPYDSSRYLLAKHAQLSLASPLFVHGNSEMDQEGDGIDGQAGQASSSPRPIRLYLHLKNFAPGELPHRSNLSGIGEQSDILDESDTSD